MGSYGAALAAFQRLAPIRVLFDNGAGSSMAGAPYPAFEHSFSSFPVPGTQARSWYLGRRGTLGASAAADRRRGPVHVEQARPPGHQLQGQHGAGPGGLWTATPTYHWDAESARDRGGLRRARR